MFEFHVFGLSKESITPKLDFGSVPPKHVPCNPLVRPHSNKTSKQHDILITKGYMKTLAICSDFDFKFS